MSCPAHDLADSRRLLTREDVDCLQRLALRLPGRGVVLELGAGSGTSALAILCVRPDLMIVSVDISEEAIHSTAELLSNAADQRFIMRPDTCWRGVIADSCDVVAIADPMADIKSGTPDALLIDSSHELEATRRELDTWLPALRSHGHVWAHDYDAAAAVAQGIDAYPGVGTAIDEAVALGRLVTGGVEGLGWWGWTPKRR